MSKKVLLLISLALAVLVGLGLVGFFVLGDSQSVDAPGESKQILQMDEFVLNLRSAKFSFLKVRISLELQSAVDRKAVISNMPKLRDAFSNYLYSVRQEEMESSAFIHALKEELLVRANKLLDPVKLRSVLIVQVLIS